MISESWSPMDSELAKICNCNARPPVRTVECALRIPVIPCVNPAMPPPAITAAVHFTIGGASIMTAADTIVPATKAAGVAKVSSRLSTTGR